MKYSKTDILFQEIPNETSLGFYITGCPGNCKGCHSAIWKNPELGEELTPKKLKQLLDKNENYITCVLFFGGEWEPDTLVPLLDCIETYGLNIALYSGLDDIESIDRRIFSRLDFLKIGSYKKELGPLSSPTTNQHLRDLRSGKDITSLLQK